MPAQGVTGWLEWLLDLEQVSLGADAPIRLQWHLPYAAWIVFGYVLLLAVFVVMSYRREAGSLSRRIGLGILRGSLLAVVVAVICRPVLVLQRSRIQPSSVVILIDDSTSMNRLDHYTDADLSRTIRVGARLGPDDTLARHSRLDLIRAALLADDSAALRSVIATHTIRLATFSRADDAYSFARIPPDGDARSAADALADLTRAIDAIEADTPSTDIATALLQILKRNDAGPLAAIVLVSDGQHSEATAVAEAIEAARGRKIPILPIIIGSPVRPPDVVVASATIQDAVFARDVLTVRARILGRGLDTPVTVDVHLRDVDADRVVASQSITLPGDSTPIEVALLTRPDRPGRVRYRVEVTPLPSERATDNNSMSVETTVVDDHLRVLYVEGYPRLEYRFLKNALLREETVRLSSLLLSADGQFAQEGDHPLRRFPETTEELEQFDVVLFGDVDPLGDWWSPMQAELLLEFVATHGGGFGLIAGERFAPHRFADTPLEKLIPVRIDSTFLGRYTSPAVSPFEFQLTDAGRQSGIFTFYEDPALNDLVVASWPGMYWIARTLGPKPGAEVLLEHASLEAMTGQMPLMVIGYYGAGRVLFQASDDTWQWRRSADGTDSGYGALHDAYWVHVVRALARPRRAVQDRRLFLQTRRVTHRLGEAVEAHLRVLDPDLLAWAVDDLRLVLLDDDEAPVSEAPLHRLSPDSGDFEATFVPPGVGRFIVRVAGVTPPAGLRPAEAIVHVTGADAESLRPQADHDLLRRIAEGTGGETIELDQLTAVLSRIPDRSLQIPDDIVEPLWDSKLVLIVFLLIISAEWTLRKVFNLA